MKETAVRSGDKLSDILSNSSENNFDIVRLFCALAVIFTHSFGLSLRTDKPADPVLHLVGFAHAGALAVAVFFLISGIFVSQSFYFGSSNIGFILKRFFRIWPGLAVCLFVTAIAGLIVSKEFLVSPMYDRSFFRYILNNSVFRLTWGIDGVFPGRPISVVNGPLWTLPLEVMMYGTVFLFGILGILRRQSYLLAVVAMGIAVLVSSPTLFTGFLGGLGARDAEIIRPVMFFLVGMAIFSAREEITLGPIYIPILLFLLACVCSATREFFGDLFIIATTLWIGCSGALRRLPKLPGDYSYGVYIYGWPIQQLIVTLFPKIGPYGLFATAATLALLCAIASWHLVEEPAQKVGKRLSALAGDPVAWRAPLRALAALGGVLRSNLRGWLAPVSAIALAGCGLAWANERIEHLPTAPLPVRIVGFGPTPVEHGKPFNVQPSGWSAIWVATDKPVDPAGFLVLGGRRLKTSISGNLLTAGVPKSVTAARGSLRLLVEFDTTTHRTQSPPAAFVVN